MATQTGQNKSRAWIKLLQTRAPGNDPDSRMTGQQVRPPSFSLTSTVKLLMRHTNGNTARRANREPKSTIQPGRFLSFTETFWELISPQESGSFNRCETWKLIVEGFQGPLQETIRVTFFQIQWKEERSRCWTAGAAVFRFMISHDFTKNHSKIGSEKNNDLCSSTLISVSIHTCHDC